MTTTRPRRTAGVPAFVWVLAASALALRLAALLVIADPSRPGMMEHDSIARSLLAGDGFAFNEAGGYTQHGRYEPTSIQSPPYPLLLAGLYRVFGIGSESAFWAATLLNVLAAAATVPLLYLLVMRLAPRDTLQVRASAAGVAACALFAVWPTQIFSVTQAQAVTFITLAYVALAWLWLVSLDTGRLLPWVAYGVVGCVAALTEPVLLPPMAFSGVWVLLTSRLPWTLRLRNGIVLLACALVFIGPWTWRNYRIHDTFMPIKHTFWVNVWKGNNATDPSHSGTDRPTLTQERLAEVRATGRDELRQYDLLTDAQRVELDGKSPAAREAVFRRMTRNWIRDNPGTYVQVSLKRLVKTLWWDWDHPTGYQAFYVYPVTRALLLLGTFAGVVLAWRARWRLGHVTLLALSAVFVYTLTVTAARFAVPLEPFQFALLGLVLAAVLTRRGGERPTAVVTYLGDRRFNDGRA